jgi:hypothetical protein
MKISTPTRLAVVAALTLFVGTHSGLAATLTLNLANNAGTAILFNGVANSFAFTSGTNGNQWTITSESGGSSAIGLQGSFNNGPFSYGPITITGSGLGQVQSATVLGPLANMVISDGTTNLTGTVNFINIATFGSAGAVGGINASLNVNLSNVQYTGSNPDLLSLKSNQPGTLDLSFQFSPGLTLTQLSTGTGPYATSYSGSLSVVLVPEPSSLTLLLTGVGLTGIGLLRRKLVA